MTVEINWDRKISYNIIFGTGKALEHGKGDWLMRIYNGKFYFNTKDYPDLAPDDFAKQVIDLLIAMPDIRKSLIDSIMKKECPDE